MTNDELSLLQSTFVKISPRRAEQATGIFCSRLFELDPALREFFHGGLAEQTFRLMQRLGLTAGCRGRLAQLAPDARQLGMRHGSRHVKDRHYETVGEALLWTLAHGLGTDFTEDARAAWGKAYWLLAETMKAGARDGAAKVNRAVA